MKNVLIVAIGDVGNEPEAIRQILERFNYFVGVKYVGRPDDFIKVLLNYLKNEVVDEEFISNVYENIKKINLENQITTFIDDALEFDISKLADFNPKIVLASTPESS